MIPKLVRPALLLLMALSFAPELSSATSAPPLPYTRWRIQVPDSLGVVGEMATLALDRDDAHIAYFQNSDCAMKFATHVRGGWKIETIETPVAPPEGGYPPCPLPRSLQLDRHGRAHLSYYRAFPGWLVFAEQVDGVWVKQVVDGPGRSLGAYSSLALDGNGQPNISYYTGESGDGLKFARRTSAGWTIELVDQAAAIRTSIALDRCGVPHIAYTSSGLRYAMRTAAGWDIQQVDTAGGSECSLALDAFGVPHVAYRGAAGQLVHAWRGASAWMRENVPGTQGARFTSIALDERGRARVSYYEESARDLMFAAQERSGWTVRRVDASGDVGTWSSLALNERGLPRIAYFDATRGDLRYAEQFGPVPEKPDSRSPDATASGEGDPAAAPPAPRALQLAASRVGVQPVIDYTLPTEGDATLTMYDVSGRVVAVLANGRTAAGAHRLAWSATGVPPGLYFCRLRTTEAEVTRSVLLLR